MVNYHIHGATKHNNSISGPIAPLWITGSFSFLCSISSITHAWPHQEDLSWYFTDTWLTLELSLAFPRLSVEFYSKTAHIPSFDILAIHLKNLNLGMSLAATDHACVMSLLASHMSFDWHLMLLYIDMEAEQLCGW